MYLVGVAELLLRLVVATLAAVTPWGRRMAARVVAKIGPQRPARAAAAVVVAIVVLTDLLVLPLVFWRGYVHDGRFGLRTQGLGGWLYDWVVVVVPVWLALGALAVLAVLLVKRRPRSWAPIAGVGVALLGGLVAFAAPLVLEPLSYDFTTLPPGPVRTEVERVLAAADQDVGQILVADASRRSVRQNAYVSGLGSSRRVVLYDTLVQQRPPAEIGVVLAHEIAHDRNGDRLRMVLLAAAGGIVSAYLLAAALRGWRRVRGRRPHGLDPRAAALAVLVLLVLNTVSLPVQSYVSRRAEAAADLGALSFTQAPDVFSRMQQGLARTNLSDPSPPRPVTLWWGSHPSPMARIGMAQWWARR